MADDQALHVDVVAASGRVWSGDALQLTARTTEGDIGIMPRHEPFLSMLVPGAVEILVDGSQRIILAVDGGFLSVTEEGVIILAEAAEFESEIDADAAKADAESDDPATAAKGRARLRAIGQLA